MYSTQSLLTGFSRRYVYALCLIAIFFSGSLLVLNSQYQLQDSDAVIINRAGEQRMLSQRIILQVHQLQQVRKDAGSTDVLESEFKRTTERMLENQAFLISQLSNFEQQASVEINERYFGHAQFNKKVNDFVDAALSVAEGIELSSQQAHFFNPRQAEVLLNELDQIVTLFEQGASRQTEDIKSLAFIMWCVTIAAVVLVGVFIFRPMGFMLQRNYNQLLTERNRIAEFQEAINEHSIVLQLDQHKTISFCNEKFKELYGYDDDEIIGKSINIIRRGNAKEWLLAVETELEKTSVWHGDTCNKAKNGHQYWFNTTVVSLKGSDGDIDKYIVIQNDITERKKTELALKRLHEVTADHNVALDDKINDLLALGCELFQLPFGIVSEINDNEYEVNYVCSPAGEINTGDKFELNNTYCFHTLKADAPLGYHHAGDSEISGHPCYQNFGLESYIGAPLFVENKRIGTLNFSGPDIRPQPFTDSDLELVQLISQWIGFEFMRKQQRDKLIAQQQLMNQMSQLARIGAWEVDLVNEKIYWSSMTKQIHEVPEDFEPELETAINFYKEGESRDKITELVDRCIRLGESYHEELQLVTAKGNEIWVAAKGEPEFRDGQCIRMFGSFQDISERKDTEIAIHDMNQRMRLAADSAGIGVWKLNVQTNELEWDDWMFRIFGVPPEQFSGAYEAWENGLHPDDKAESVKSLQEGIVNGEKFSTQFRIILPNGDIKHIAAHAIPEFNEQGEVTAMVGINYDISERVENEMAITEAKIQAEAAARAKNEFLASMSHEIRTPMNGVIGMLDLLNDTELTKEQRHRVSIAQSSASSLLHLINDILDFSKIDADKLDLEFIPFDLRKMMGELAESLATQAQSKKLELVLDTVAVVEPQIVGDPSRIRQILTNLASNSIKFTHEGEVLIKAELKDEDTGFWRLRLRVVDTGIGIAKDKQEALFESFSQVDSSTTRHYGGTGLGLAIVKKLCQRMNGDVNVISELGRGSEFICDIRVGKTMQVDRSMPSVDVTKLEVLVVDDNATNREVISRQLQKWGAKVVNAATGYQAIQICQQRIENKEKIFDIGILDMQMPVMNGEMLAGELRKLKALAPMKFIMMTSMQTRGDGKYFASLGFSGYFPKPATTTDLFAALNIIADDGEALRQANPLVTKHYIKEIVVQDPEEKTEQTESESQVETDIATEKLSKQLKVLLVEDNRVNQMVAKGVLTKIGYHCDIAINGIDALKKLNTAETMYDLALMDIQMPEMDGYEATQRIRAGEAGSQHQTMKIIAMTANAMTGDREKCLAAGMDDYLAKPIDKDMLQDKINRHFTHH